MRAEQGQYGGACVRSAGSRECRAVRASRRRPRRPSRCVRRPRCRVNLKGDVVGLGAGDLVAAGRSRRRQGSVPNRAHRQCGPIRVVSRWLSDLQAQRAQNLLNAHCMMSGNALQNARQCLCPDRIVQGDDFVVFTTLLRRDSHVRASLSYCFVSQSSKCRLQPGATYVAG